MGLVADRRPHPGPARSPRRWRPVSRATTRADKLPALPPETKHPPAEAGRPARSANRRKVWFSAETAPAASSHDVPWREEPTRPCRTTATPWSEPRDEGEERGLSQEMTAGCEMVREEIQHGGRILRLEPRAPASALSSTALSPGRSRTTGSSDNRSPAIIEDQGSQSIIGDEHRVTHRFSLPHPGAVTPTEPAAAPRAGMLRGWRAPGLVQPDIRWRPADRRPSADRSRRCRRHRRPPLKRPCDCGV